MILIDTVRFAQGLREFWNEGVAPIVGAVSSLQSRMTTAETNIENLDSPFQTDSGGYIAYNYPDSEEGEVNNGT